MTNDWIGRAARRIYGYVLQDAVESGSCSHEDELAIAEIIREECPLREVAAEAPGDWADKAARDIHFKFDLSRHAPVDTSVPTLAAMIRARNREEIDKRLRAPLDLGGVRKDL